MIKFRFIQGIVSKTYFSNSLQTCSSFKNISPNFCIYCVLLSRIFHQISVFIVLTTWASRLDNITFYLPKPQMYSVVRTCRNKRENTRSQRRLRICCHVLTSRWYYHTAVTPHASSCPGPKMEAGAGRSRQTRLCAGRRRQLNYTVLFKASVWNRSRE